MSTRSWFLKTGFFILVSALQAAGQTTGDAEAKHETTFQAHKIRPGIMMRVQRNAGGQISQARIERFSGTDSTISLERAIDADLVKEIIDELAPITERGAQGDFFGFGFGFGHSWTGITTTNLYRSGWSAR